MNASSDLCKTYALYFPAKRCCWVDPCSFVIQVHNISSDPSIFFLSVHVHIVWRDKILGWVINGICIMLSYLIIGMEVENIYRREYRCDSFFYWSKLKYFSHWSIVLAYWLFSRPHYPCTNDATQLWYHCSVFRTFIAIIVFSPEEKRD
mgnify:CR=1 FL=1